MILGLKRPESFLLPIFLFVPGPEGHRGYIRQHLLQERVVYNQHVGALHRGDLTQVNLLYV